LLHQTRQHQYRQKIQCVGLSITCIPDDNRPCPVIAFRDDPLKCPVFERMVIDDDRKPFVLGDIDGPFGTAQDLRTPSISSLRS
jgi:hypothetical protein